MPEWKDMTPKEREDYVNQDYVQKSYITIDVDSISTETNIASEQEFYKIPHEGIRFFKKYLTKKQYEVIMLKFYHGLSFQQMADKLNISKISAYNRYEWAKKKISKIRNEIC